MITIVQDIVQDINVQDMNISEDPHETFVIVFNGIFTVFYFISDFTLNLICILSRQRRQINFFLAPDWWAAGRCLLEG